jgi:glycosyltransferase involved in cell wall biosynthesis
MQFSVLIPTYNSAPLVVEAVQSVLAQSHAAAQIIVVDDGSTDDTAERLRPYHGKIDYVRQSNARVAAARNTGLSLCTGDAIAFLDADDYWHPEKLARQRTILEQHAEIGLLSTDTFDWPGTMSSIDNRACGQIEMVPLSRLLVCNSLTTSSIVVRSSVMARVGRFDTELFGPEDYDLWLRCAQVSPVAVLRERLTGYRNTAGSLGKQAQTMREGLLRIHAKLDAANAWPSALLRRRCRAHLDYSTAYMYLAGGEPGRAASLMAQSLLGYPLPMSSAEVRYRFGRLRLLMRAAWRHVRGLRPRPATAAG